MSRKVPDLALKLIIGDGVFFDLRVPFPEHTELASASARTYIYVVLPDDDPGVIKSLSV